MWILTVSLLSVTVGEVGSAIIGVYLETCLVLRAEFVFGKPSHVIFVRFRFVTLMWVQEEIDPSE